MTMQELYDEMKEALADFGLRFHEMDKVEVTIKKDGEIQFSLRQTKTIKVTKQKGGSS